MLVLAVLLVSTILWVISTQATIKSTDYANCGFATVYSDYSYGAEFELDGKTLKFLGVGGV